MPLCHYRKPSRLHWSCDAESRPLAGPDTDVSRCVRPGSRFSCRCGSGSPGGSFRHDDRAEPLATK